MVRKQREDHQKDALNKKIAMMEHQLKRLQSDKKNLQKTLRVRQLIRAGMIFEEAGILDEYDRQEVLAALKRLAEHKRGGNVA